MDDWIEGIVNEVLAGRVDKLLMFTVKKSWPKVITGERWFRGHYLDIPCMLVWLVSLFGMTAYYESAGAEMPQWIQLSLTLGFLAFLGYVGADRVRRWRLKRAGIA